MRTTRLFLPCTHYTAPAFPLCRHVRSAADLTARAALANIRNASGETPLHRAAACRTALACGSMSYLLAAGADPDARDVRGATPLLHIITEGRARCVDACSCRVNNC